MATKNDPLETAAARIEALAAQLADEIERAREATGGSESFQNVTAAYAAEVRSRYGEWMPRRLRGMTTDGKE